MADQQPEPERRSGSEQKMPGRCGAKIRNSDPPRYCMAVPLRGRTRCRFHGGASPRGWASPNTRTGAHCRYAIVPPELEPAFRAAKDDPHRLDLLEELDLVKAKIEAIWAQVAQAAKLCGKLDGKGEAQASPPWLQLRDAWDTVMRAEHGTPARRMAEAKLGALVNAGATQDQALAQILELMEVARRVAETQTKRDQLMGQFVPVDKVQMLVRQVSATIQRHVRDRRALAAIQSDLLQLTGRPQPLDRSGSTAVARTA